MSETPDINYDTYNESFDKKFPFIYEIEKIYEMIYIFQDEINKYSSEIANFEKLKKISSRINTRINDNITNNNRLNNIRLDNLRINNNVPENGKPENGKPENGKPENGKPENGKPENGKPNDDVPDDDVPNDDALNNENRQDDIKTISLNQNINNNIKQIDNRINRFQMEIDNLNILLDKIDIIKNLNSDEKQLLFDFYDILGYDRRKFINVTLDKYQNFINYVKPIIYDGYIPIDELHSILKIIFDTEEINQRRETNEINFNLINM